MGRYSLGRAGGKFEVKFDTGAWFGYTTITMPALSLMNDMHYAVISDLLHGATLEESCELHGLDIVQWRKIYRGRAFREALAERKRTFERDEEDEAIALFKEHKFQAAQRLITEMDNEEASSTARQSAANSVLAYAGVQPRAPEHTAQPTVVINISAADAEILRRVTEPHDIPLEDITCD